MVMFFVFTAIFILSNVGMGKFMLFAISEGQIIDKWFGWQKMLDKLYSKSPMLCKLLGHCEYCFLHLMTIINFIMYCVFMNKIMEFWITDLLSVFSIWFWVCNIIWYIVYGTIAWMASVSINLKKETNGL